MSENLISTNIKKIEDLSLNAWPSWQMQVYDGWILRYSHFYTHRTNCVEEIGVPEIPLAEKIMFCEDAYKWWGTPCIFKISPITSPGLDGLLKDRGYGIEHVTTVMTRSLDDLPAPGTRTGPNAVPMLRVTDRVDAFWLDTLFSLKGDVSPLHRQIVPNMYAAIPKREIPVLILAGGEAVASGLGILDRDAVGVYAIHVREDYRRRGFARLVVSEILSRAKNQGAKFAYLQVVSSNLPAKSLYRSLGFHERYSCYFRVRNSEGGPL